MVAIGVKFCLLLVIICANARSIDMLSEENKGLDEQTIFLRKLLKDNIGLIDSSNTNELHDESDDVKPKLRDIIKAPQPCPPGYEKTKLGRCRKTL